MASQPPKRRKTSPSKSIPILDPESAAQTPTRASYMSPTRASLSRFNPSLLPQRLATGSSPSRQTPRASLPPSDPRSDLLSRGQDAFNYIMSEVGTAIQGALAAAGQQPQTPNVPMVITGKETDEQMAAMRAANRARRENERLGSGRVSQAPSSVDGAPGTRRPSFESIAADELAKGDLPQDLEEDELPETPEALRRQIEVEDTPPRGVLFSSPVKRWKRGSRLKKPIPVPVPDIEPQPQGDNGKAEAANMTKRQQPAESQAYPIKDADVLAKEVEKARLDKELELLRVEVRQYEEQINRLNNLTEDGDSPENLADLITLITSKSSDTRPVPKPAPLSSLLTSFLPFSLPIESPPTPPASPGEKNIPSHLPIREKDPLPLLSLFTPFTITSVIDSPSNPSSASDAIKQNHVITLISPGSLLSCSLGLVIASNPLEPGQPTVDSLEIRSLSQWAKREVGEWLDDRSQEGDVAAIGYALGRYWDLSIRRAQCWAKCSKQMSSLIKSTGRFQSKGGGNIDEPQVPTRSVRGKGRPRKGQQVDDGEQNLSSNDEDANPDAALNISKKELMPYLGREALLLKSEDVALRISWRFQFDWTGEVESIVSARAAFPQVWHETPDVDALKKIPATFDVLVEERGVYEAVRIVSGLLFTR